MPDVLIVGGGPVGLFLGCLLTARGVAVQVLESRSRPGGHSRAIGIHPPALAAFGDVGLARPMLDAGLPILRGLVTGERGVLGELDFATLESGAAAHHPFVLSLPQRDTEAVLRRRLAELAPGAYCPGVEVQELHEHGTQVRVVAAENGARREFTARFVVGADGWRSRVREALGLAFPGKVYPDKYLMGDFPDTTPLNTTALVSLTAGGVVESFPLPRGGRRWVVHTGSTLHTEATARDLSATVLARTGLYVPAAECQMLSAFEVRRHRVPQMVVGRSVLIGDAAHVVSPIGGQGMNLGWLDAAALAPLLVQALDGPQRSSGALNRFGPARLRSARVAARQAELNMSAGRPVGARTQRAREELVRSLLSPASAPLLARAFTMQWL
ncbi:FAD-dependent oxidoreductase [Deinococcus aerophilus]|uniref:Oxidoreductase n=1 Tax=Deinococcus aerophilus TaxID=522488 RepID=A0ABQ2GIT8_9DEIO|nr:NAD(P)/FAD-dependent oxidoreductase [Deinococcus aerophilus]GGL98314.1 oxidoreductase [Deinococcus aerophilus]